MKVHVDLLAGLVMAVDLPALAAGHVQLYHIVLVAQGLKLLRHLLGGEPFGLRLVGAGRAGHGSTGQGTQGGEENRGGTVHGKVLVSNKG